MINDTILTGKFIRDYEIRELIGKGSMGNVYRARKSGSQQDVAIKVITKVYVNDSEVHNRFRREIHLLFELRHPNIVPIYDFGIYHHLIYFTMKLLTGDSLYELLDRQRFSPLSAKVILDQITEALDFGHEKGVVHRDMKPENVFIEKVQDKLHCYLGDFGLAKRPGIDPSITQTGIAVGTEHFISPEAVRGLPIDHRADIYGLAVMTYEMLLGRLPFDERDTRATAIAHLTKQPPPPSSLNRAFPKLLEKVILKGLEKDPENRQQSAAEFMTEYNLALLQLSQEQLQSIYWV